ncbi:MAG: class I SAM-dependent methyltransferase [Corynebacterium sp.]|nr:class I SAM-dependent methyltransferase [Corynebacterium sp.]
MPTWKEIVAANPLHSQNYARRWENIAARGQDIYGEARLIDALAPRGAKILDAGCGQGRLSGYLQQCGHEVTGVDLDAFLLEVAQEKHPEVNFAQIDLGIDPLPGKDYDLIFSAGNVLPFIPQEQRAAAVTSLIAALAPGARLVIGFGLDRGYSAGDFFSHVSAAGGLVEHSFSSWDLQPFESDSNFLVAVIRRG